MQVQQLPIYQFLEGSGKSFVIPVYQRDYAWTKNNCSKLWDDLVHLSQNGREDHFLGTLVTIGSGFQEYTIIDGQQRLTTISILLISLYDYLKDKNNKNSEENILKEQILDFLINKYSHDGGQRIRLKPNKQDREHFENLFLDKAPKSFDSNINNNYQFFLEKIKGGSLSPQQIFDSFRKLKIVLIDLIRNQDDPQLIFESLNSTGVDLTAGDLIRNFILMDMAPVEQEKMYKQYWVKIEKLTGDIAEFVRNYLIFKLKVWTKKDDVYISFKNFSLENFNLEKENILKDLLFYAEIYSWLVQINQNPNKKINLKLKKLKKLEFTICYPYLLDLFNELLNENIKEKDVEDSLNIIESYAFRKILVDNTTQGLNKLFIALARDIKKETSWKDNYVEILNYILLDKKISQRFPNNEEFENALINKEIYKLQSKNKYFLLESLENFHSAYNIDLNDLTIEHIMPQTLTKKWKERLGENWQEVYNKYLHTLGNLSLTAKNTELSNNSFEEKKKIDYQISKLKLNFDLSKCDSWSEKDIIERAKKLTIDAMQIWPYPQTSYTKTVKEEQLFDLTSEDDFTGTKPLKLYLEDREPLILKNWRDVLVGVCSFLYNYSPTQFTELKNSPEFQWYFNSNKPLRCSLEFADGEFVEGNQSANYIISFLNKISSKLKYPSEDIQFSLKL